MEQQLIALVLGEVRQEVRGTLFRPPLRKSAPGYSGTAVPGRVAIGQETVDVGGREVTFVLRGYPPEVLLIEARITLDTLFSRDTFEIEAQVYEHAYRILQEHGGSRDSSEEYSVFTVADYEGAPEQFYEHGPLIASLLKSERLELDPHEVEHTLQSSIKYARNDLAVVDWDGAMLFDAEGSFEEEIELLTLANLQLLRHRSLDRQLDERLAHMADLVQKTADGRPLQSKELASDFRAIVRARMASISELRRLGRDIKLIGEWYSARLFDLATTKFKIDEWQRSIRSKLDSLEDVYAMIAENFSVSTKHRAEWIQILAFFVLQIGWFILIVLELWRFTHH